MKHQTNTSGFSLYPECSVVLKVTGVVLKSKRDDSSVKFYVWSFDTLQSDNETIENELQFLFFSSQMGGLLTALGCTETSPGKFDWDDEEVKGKTIRADITHQILKGDTKHTLINIEPYQEEQVVNTEEEKAWDENK